MKLQFSTTFYFLPVGSVGSDHTVLTKVTAECQNAATLLKEIGPTAQQAPTLQQSYRYTYIYVYIYTYVYSIFIYLKYFLCIFFSDFVFIFPTIWFLKTCLHLKVLKISSLQTGLYCYHFYFFFTSLSHCAASFPRSAPFPQWSLIFSNYVHLTLLVCLNHAVGWRVRIPEPALWGRLQVLTLALVAPLDHSRTILSKYPECEPVQLQLGNVKVLPVHSKKSSGAIIHCAVTLCFSRHWICFAAPGLNIVLDVQTTTPLYLPKTTFSLPNSNEGHLSLLCREASKQQATTDKRSPKYFGPAQSTWSLNPSQRLFHLTSPLFEMSRGGGVLMTV